MRVFQYDIAAVLIIISIMAHFPTRKEIRTKLTQMFYLMLCVGLVASGLNITFSLLENNGYYGPESVRMAIRIIYLIACNISPAIYLTYLYMLVSGNSMKLKRNEKLAVCIPAAIDVLLLITNPLHKQMFYFDANKLYQRGPLFVVLYMVSVFYLVICGFVMIRNRMKLTKGQRYTAYSYLALTVGAVLVQMLLPTGPITQMAGAVAMLLIYMTLENPENYNDRQIDCYNRLAFRNVMQRKMQSNKPFKVIAVRTQELSSLNDILGTKNVDLMLKSIVEYLTSVVGRKRVFRLSGLTFVLMLDNPFLKEEDIVNKVLNRFNKPFHVEDMDITIKAQMATVSYPADAISVEDVIDMLEYTLDDMAKDEKARVAHANKNMLDRKRRETLVLRAMRKALKEKSFRVFYQPIHSVEKKAFTSAEALIRLIDDDLGFIGPDEFIPMAEKNGMILEIGEFVFREVCRFVTENKIWEAGIENVHVNLSVVQCMQEKLSEQLISIMDEYGLDYSFIHLEVTETAAATSRDMLRTNMQKLRECGINFALDDYGTGFSNLMSLTDYPFALIKIDKSIVWAAMEKEKAMCTLKHTIAMINDMDMEIVAEGVETLEQAQKLEEMGCFYFQGYYYSKPISAEDFKELLKGA